MPAGDIARASEFNTFYTRLNACRTRAGLAVVSYTAATVGSAMTSAQMTTLLGHYNTTKAHKYYTGSSPVWTPGETINVGHKITYSTMSTLSAALVALENACMNDAVFNTNSTNSTQSNDSDRNNMNDNSTWIQCSVNSTNSVSPW